MPGGDFYEQAHPRGGPAVQSGRRVPVCPQHLLLCPRLRLCPRRHLGPGPHRQLPVAPARGHHHAGVQPASRGPEHPLCGPGLSGKIAGEHGVVHRFSGCRLCPGGLLYRRPAGGSPVCRRHLGLRAGPALHAGLFQRRHGFPHHVHQGAAAPPLHRGGHGRH